MELLLEIQKMKKNYFKLQKQDFLSGWSKFVQPTN